jgi:hypothetical protein
MVGGVVYTDGKMLPPPPRQNLTLCACASPLIPMANWVRLASSRSIEAESGWIRNGTRNLVGSETGQGCIFVAIAMFLGVVPNGLALARPAKASI